MSPGSYFGGMNNGGSRQVKVKERPRCPFYGFGRVAESKLLFDTNSKQCSLAVDSHVLCKMNETGLSPNWDECHFNSLGNKEVIDTIIRKCRVTPKEFCPQDRKSWEGIPLAVWSKMVMSK